MVLENAGALAGFRFRGLGVRISPGAPFRRNDRSGEPTHSRAT